MLGLAIRYGHIEDADDIAELVNCGAFHSATSSGDVAEMLSRGTFLVLDRQRGGLAGSVFIEIREGRGELGLLRVASDLDLPDLPRRLIEVAEMVCVAEGCDALEVRLDGGEQLPEIRREMGLEPLKSDRDGTRLGKRL